MTSAVVEKYITDNEDDLYYGHGPWNFKIQSISDLTNHTSLYDSYLNNNIELTTREDFVQMPFCGQITNSLVPKTTDRWTVMKQFLSKKITTTAELEDVLKNYNTNTQEFLALKHFLDEFLDAVQTDHFFKRVLPGIIELALRLPELLQRDLPILKQGTSSSVSLSQLQVASLLANAFLCTFPCKPTLCPGINFNRLFSSHSRVKRINCVSEKLKSICHYFDRIISNEPTGTITFERKSFIDQDLPSWENITKNLGDTKVYIRSTGLIEDDANGFLQVDFANKNVGGGVLAYGCVQEEIRFVICPELLVSRLFTEQLCPTEGLIITGAERYSNYSGYGDSYEWKENYIDNTPRDLFGRRLTKIVAIDATRFTKSVEQYKVSHILRELNKAYAGFQSDFKEQLPPVATGNWGCGAYRGDPKLKFLIQLMACTVSRRDMVYFTFNDDELSLKLKEMYVFLTQNSVTIAQLWKYLKWFSLTKLKPDSLYTFIYHVHFNQSHSEKDLSNFQSKNFQKPVVKHQKRVVDGDEVNEDICHDLSSFFQLSL